MSFLLSVFLISFSSHSSVPCHKASSRICKIEYLVAQYTNGARNKKNLNSTRYSNKLAFAAREWSMSQAKRRRIGHSGYPNRRMRSMKKEFGSVSFRMYGENVWLGGGYRTANHGTTKQIAYRIYRAWKRSRPHRKNLLRKGARYQGVGVVYRKGTYYATQLFGR